MLSEAARLGRIGTAYWSARQFEHADAAHAGARLLTVTAQTHLEQVR
jgi:hypothetical protein